MSSEVAATLMIGRYNCNRQTVMMYVGGSYHHLPTMHISFLSSFKSSRHMYMYFFTSITQGGGTPRTNAIR